ESRFYAGEYPELVIPLPDADHHAWRAYALSWRSLLDDSQPEQKARLEDLVGGGIKDSIRLPLSHPDFLGSQAVGPYRLRFRGRLAQDATFHVCLLPGMTFEFRESQLVPAASAGPPETELCIRFASPVKLWLDEEPTNIPLLPVNPDGVEYRLRIRPDQRV